MMRTAILLVVALALTAVAVPVASAEVYCKDEPRVDARACVLVTEDCITAGGHVGRLWFEGHCP